MNLSSKLADPGDCLDQTAAIRMRIDRRLTELLPEAQGRSDPLTQAMREASLSPGKRVRSVLLLLGAQGLGHDSPALVDLGCALEMVHASSLILDDMPCMDNANLRRGRATIHRQFGEDLAILASVALLSRAFSVVSAAPGLAPALRAEAVSQLAHAIGDQGLVRGQYEDLHEGRGPRSATAISVTNNLKTGVLFEAAMAMAVIVAQAPDSVARSLRRFALQLGQAFQLLDDLVDNWASSGKDRGQDQGKSTLIALLGPEQVLQRLTEHLDEADQQLTCVYGPDQAVSRFMRGLFSQANHALAAQVW